jgi:hypothetical protein
MKSIRNLSGLLLVLLSFSAARAEFRPGLACIELDRVTLTVDKKVLQLVRKENTTGKLTLTGFYSDGSQRTLRPSEAAIKAKTKAASGNVEVVTIKGDEVAPQEGGIATIEAAVVEGGKTFTAGTDVVVSPFYRDYHQTLVLKLFLGYEGDPVERLAKDPVLSKKGHETLCSFEEALEVIRKTDNLTRGIPKILYLVGWLQGGPNYLLFFAEPRVVTENTMRRGVVPDLAK